MMNVGQEKFDDVWEHVEPWLIHALEHDGSKDTIEDVKLAVQEGRVQLFHHTTGAAITLIDTNTRVPTLHVWLAGGDIPAMKELLPSFVAFAKMSGCAKIAFLGRSGWQRTFLTEAGFKTTAVIMEKIVEADDGQVQHNH